MKTEHEYVRIEALEGDEAAAAFGFGHMGSEASTLQAFQGFLAGYTPQEDVQTWTVKQCVQRSLARSRDRWVIGMSEDAAVFWCGEEIFPSDLPVSLAPCLLLEAGTITHVPFSDQRFPDIKTSQLSASQDKGEPGGGATTRQEAAAMFTPIVKTYVSESGSGHNYAMVGYSMYGEPLYELWYRHKEGGPEVIPAMHDVVGRDGTCVQVGSDLVYMSSAADTLSPEQATVVMGTTQMLKASAEGLDFREVLRVLGPAVGDFQALVGEHVTGLAFNATHAAFNGIGRHMVCTIMGVKDDVGFMDGVQVYTALDCVQDLPCGISHALEYQHAIVLVLPRPPHGPLRVIAYVSRPKPEHAASTPGVAPAIRAAKVPLPPPESSAHGHHDSPPSPLLRFVTNPTLAFVLDVGTSG